MKDLTDVDTFHGTITVPEDGIDPRTAASVEDAFQKLTDRTHYLNERREHDHNLLLLNAHLHYPVVYDPGAANWGVLSSNTVGLRVMRQTNVSDSFRYFNIPLTGLPAAGWRFSQVGVWLKGASLHVAGTNPDVSLWRYDLSMSTTGTQVGATGTDNTNASGYDDWHFVSVGDLAGEEIELGSVYHVRVGGEAGVDAEQLLECYGGRVILNVPSSCPYP